MTSDAASQAPPLWRNLRVLRIVGQAAVLLLVGLLFAWLWNNLLINTQQQNLPPPTDFGYLDQPIGQSIAGSDLRPTESRLDALLVGVGRTVQIAVIGIVMTTVLGVLIGMARLSRNWLVSQVARLYVELFRNTPPLVVIIFVYTGIFLNGGLPEAASPIEIPKLLVADVRGISVPWLTLSGSGVAVGAAVVLALAVALLVHRLQRLRGERTGHTTAPVWSGVGAFAVVGLVAWLLLGRPVGLTVPEFSGGELSGGAILRPEYAALLLGLVLYTASHVAEITRASIQAVPRGQTEASAALGLSAAQRMRRVILPQALRVSIPPMANQYLNLTKNSSLAVAVAYVEMTKVTRDIVANGAPAFQGFLLLAMIYLAISLTIAALTNLVNARLAIPER